MSFYKKVQEVADALRGNSCNHTYEVTLIVNGNNIQFPLVHFTYLINTNSALGYRSGSKLELVLKIEVDPDEMNGVTITKQEGNGK